MNDLGKYTMALWLLNHEQFSAFQRLYHTLSLYPFLSFLFSPLSHTQTHTHICTHLSLRPISTPAEVLFGFQTKAQKTPHEGEGLALSLAAAPPLQLTAREATLKKGMLHHECSLRQSMPCAYTHKEQPLAAPAVWDHLHAITTG